MIPLTNHDSSEVAGFGRYNLPRYIIYIPSTTWQWQPTWKFTLPFSHVVVKRGRSDVSTGIFLLKNDILCQNKLEQTLIFLVHTLKRKHVGVSKSIFSKYFKCPMAVP